MEFSNLYLIYFFLPITAAVYFLMKDIRKKNMVLIIASLIFYAMGQPLYLPLLLGTAWFNYHFGRCVRPGDKASLYVPIGVNIGILCVFKYLDFFLGIFGITGSDGGGVLNWALPMGISFYTFQLIAYHVDIYRKKTEASDQFSEFLLYIAMFPKMLMGPIVRYEQIEKQLYNRKTSSRSIFEGIVRFVVGLAKKVLIADYAFSVYDQTTSMAYGGAAWLGALMFMFYIYFEFSGCTDMAIGLGRIFGFRYAENFNLPYTSRSITEFWRKWHMTLGSFFRDYVYIPLGGNRKGKARQILNLFAVWSLTGLWHGANWNYIFWGVYFFLLLVAEKQLMPKLEKLPYIVRNLITMFLVLIGWVIFANEDLGVLGNTIAAMFGKGSFWHGSVSALLGNSVPLILLCIVGSTPVPRMIGFIWSGMFGRGQKAGKITARNAVYAVGMLLFAAVLLYFCTASLVGAASKPSLYASF